MFNTISLQTELVAKEVVDIAFKVHTHLGPGLLESVYEKCLCYKLARRKIAFKRQQTVEILYDELIIGDGLKIDILVNEEIIIE